MNSKAFVLSADEVKRYIEMRTSGDTERKAIVSLYLRRITGKEDTKEIWVEGTDNMFPFFYRVYTGKEGMVICKGKNKNMLSGYNGEGEQIFKEYEEQESPLVLKLDKEENLECYFIWITLFMKNIHYISLESKGKVEAIRNYFIMN